MSGAINKGQMLRLFSLDCASRAMAKANINNLNVEQGIARAIEYFSKPGCVTRVAGNHPLVSFSQRIATLKIKGMQRDDALRVLANALKEDPVEASNAARKALLHMHRMTYHVGDMAATLGVTGPIARAQQARHDAFLMILERREAQFMQFGARALDMPWPDEELEED